MALKTEPAKKTQSLRIAQPAKNAKPPIKAKQAITTQPAKNNKSQRKVTVTKTQSAKKNKIKKAPATTQPVKNNKPQRKVTATKTPSAKKNKIKKAPATTQPVKNNKPQRKVTATKTPSAKKNKPKKAPPVTTALTAKKKKLPKKVAKTTPKPNKKFKQPIKSTPKSTEKLKATTVKGKSPFKVKHNLDKTYFCVLRNYGSYANKSKKLEKVYPWIARVIHSKTKDFPHKCSASCIGPRLFVTAARCITILVVEYTHVKYATVRLPVLAFVVPSNPTKQMFDDVGIIVVEATSFKGPWPSISLTNMKRTDNDYEWLDKLQLEKAELGTHVAVGYAMDNLITRATVYEEHKLFSLNVVVGMSFCYQILQVNKTNSPDFWVPCYHPCTMKLHNERTPVCFKYLGALGAAVIDSKSNTLIGVATWGARLTGTNPPVGFAIPNSKNFFDDLACAKKVLKDNGATADMQSICPLPKKPK